MKKCILLLFLSFITMFSLNTYAADIADAGTIKLLQESFKNNQNDTVISGLSIGFATDMLANGATGKSLEQLTGFLGMSVADKNNGLHEQMMNLPSTLEISNSIWGNVFKEEYKKTLLNVLNVSVGRLPKNTSAINKWIAEKTHDKVQNVLEEKATKPEELYLVNTIYFKDEWKTKFQKEATKDEVFYKLSGDTINIPMMHNTKHILYAENDVLQSVKLPYKNGGNMIIYLPRENMDFKEFIANLTPADMDLDYKSERVALTLPKMKIEKKTDVKDLFKKLGITEIFVNGIKDFNNIAPDDPYVTDIAHQAIIEMDEDGTTASAATTVVMLRMTSVGPGHQQPPIPFVANRPFVFFMTQGDFIGVYTGTTK